MSDQSQPIDFGNTDAAAAAVGGVTATGTKKWPGNSPIVGPKTIGGDRGAQLAPNADRTGLRMGDVVFDPEAGTMGVSATYADGDEWAPASFGWGPEEIARIQVAMVMAGLLDDGSPRGAWEGQSASAFKKVLDFANRTGLDWENALDRILSGAPEQKGPKGPVFTARLSNPDDLKEVFRQAAYSQLGGRGFVDDEQLQRFVDTYQEQEMKAQRAAFSAQTGSGGTVVEQPQAQTVATEALKAEDPDGYQAAQFAKYASVLEGLIGGSGGGG